MRGTRWLVLAAIAAILSGVGLTYRLQKRVLQQEAPAQPKALPPGLNSSFEDWNWSQTSGQHTDVQIHAKNVKQAKETSRTELQDVELKIFHKNGDAYDLVRSAQAEFFAPEKRLFSEGNVEITLAVPVDEPPTNRLISIRSSGVTFDSATGKAATDRPASFAFQNGDGKAVGASYDPSTRELHMNSQVELHWKATTRHGKPMKVEAGELTYKESAATVWLQPWARLTRDNTVIDGANTVVTLQNQVVHLVESHNARGVDSYPKRQLQYAADQLWVNFSDRGEVEHIRGESNARLVSTSEGAETTVTADRVDLDFADINNESVLTKVLANGNGVVESKPLPLSGRLLPETRVLRSQTVEVKMRPGGREIDMVETQAPGVLEFLPNRPGQRHRTLDGERMWISYGAQNQIQSFRAVETKTRTDPTPEERARHRPLAITRSKNLSAQFDPKTGQMILMEQWDDFSYEEGDREARAARASLDSNQNLIHLETAARMWDASGSTSADRIRLDQRSGSFTAQGHVNSSRLPEKKKPASDVLSGDEPTHALAENMVSSDHNRLIHYEGNVVLWQDANRVQGDRIDIDREHKRMTASGHVVTQSMEKPDSDSSAKSAPAAVFTIVKAGKLVYTDQDRLAHYSGGVFLNRPGLQVKAAELRAFLAESGADSRMEKTYADGQVQIVQTAPDRTRTGTGEHAEYYTGEQKVVLRGGEPQLIDSRKGNTRGVELTYFANDDRLLVNGAPDRPATSRIRRK